MESCDEWAIRSRNGNGMMKETELGDDYVQHTESIAIWERKLLASQCTCHGDD